MYLKLFLLIFIGLSVFSDNLEVQHNERIQNFCISPNSNFRNSINYLVDSFYKQIFSDQKLLYDDNIEKLITAPFTDKITDYFDNLLTFYLNGKAKDEYSDLKIENDSKSVAEHTARFAASIFQLLNTDIDKLTKDQIKYMHKVLKPFNTVENFTDVKYSLSQIKKITNYFHPKVWYFIAISHDLGKLKGPNAAHEERSFEILTNSGFLKRWQKKHRNILGKDRSEQDENIILMNLIIKYHGVLGLTYSGESTFSALNNIFLDPMLIQYIAKNNSTYEKISFDLKKARKLFNLLNIVTIFDTAAVMKEGVVNLRTINYKNKLVDTIIDSLEKADGLSASHITRILTKQEGTVDAINDRLQRLVFFVDRNLDKKISNKHYLSFSPVLEKDQIILKLLPRTNFSVFNYPFGHFAWNRTKERFKFSPEKTEAIKFFDIPKSCEYSKNIGKFFYSILKGAFALKYNIDYSLSDSDFLSIIQSSSDQVLIKMVDEENRGRFDNNPEKLASLPIILSDTIDMTESFTISDNKLYFLDGNNNKLESAFLEIDGDVISIVIANKVIPNNSSIINLQETTAKSA